MSTTFNLDTSTSRANPTPQPMKRLTVPGIRTRKQDGVTAEPIVMLTAYTARQAQLLDAHCDMLLVGDSLGQVIYGLPSTVPVTLEMMANHGAAVVRGSYHSAVIVDMPFGSYEGSPAQAFASASMLIKQSGAAAVQLEGGAAMAETVAFLTERGIPVMGHVGLTPQAVNVLGGSPGANASFHTVLPWPTSVCAQTHSPSLPSPQTCRGVQGGGACGKRKLPLLLLLLLRARAHHRQLPARLRSAHSP